MTASSDDDVWDKCLQIGINGVIQKPVVLKNFYELRESWQTKLSDKHSTKCRNSYGEDIEFR
uniref:Uncharacterized protein n=1 Tax=Salix viminalis TaxID=40686 RepID=A0A6N2MNQ4_SALVM